MMMGDRGRDRRRRRAAAPGAAIIGSAAAYILLVRPWQLRWVPPTRNATPPSPTAFIANDLFVREDLLERRWVKEWMLD
jgi:hypothetical protein